MIFHTCPRSSEIRHGRAPLGAGLRAHLAACQECRDTWLVSAAMKTVAEAPAPDPHADASADRILLLARLALSERRDKVHRHVASWSFVVLVVIWVGLAGRAAGNFPPESLARGLILVLTALATTLWLSTEKRLEVGRY